MNERPVAIIKVSSDCGEAELHAPAGLDTAALTVQSLLKVAIQAKVFVDAPLEQKLDEFIQAYGDGHAPLTRVIASSTRPSKGEQGRIEWIPEYDPKGAATPGDAARPGGVDFYSGRAYAKVKAGTIVGRLVPPTRGTPGRDVRGRTLDGLPGDPAPIEFDKTLYCDSGNSLVARVDGILAFDRNRVCVSQVLEVSGNVDFSSGHIDFAGDVSVAHGVKSGFKIKSGGTLRVEGLVEVADITCAKHLELRLGMAGNGSGTLSVGGDAHVGYLNCVSGTIQGSLSVQRELVDCTLVVGNDLLCPNGTVFGGELNVTGSLIVKVLGCEAFTPTSLTLGDVPLLKLSRHEIVKAIEQIDLKSRKLDEQERCIRLNPRPSPAERERLTEFAFERSELKQEHNARSEHLRQIDETFNTARRLDIQINKAVYPNVSLRIGEYVVQFKELVKGPLAICWDIQKNLICRIGSSDARPLNTIAHVSRDASDQAQSRAKAA